MSELAYFKKELLRNRLHNSKRELILWESVGGDCGVKVVDPATDKDTFDFLEDLAAKRRMGVTRISKEIYEGLKKNPLPTRTSPLPSVGQPIRVFDRESVLPKAKVSAGVQPAVNVAESEQPKAPAPIPAPTPSLSAKNPPRAFQKRTAKASEVQSKTNPEPTAKPPIEGATA